MVHFNVILDYFPCLENQHFQVLIVGYGQCPYFRRAMTLTEAMAVTSIPMSWPEGKLFKDDIGYNGTLPLIFLRTEQGVQDVKDLVGSGGTAGLEQWLKKQ